MSISLLERVGQIVWCRCYLTSNDGSYTAKDNARKETLSMGTNFKTEDDQMEATSRQEARSETVSLKLLRALSWFLTTQA
jgi:threonyl-tRNA synthetase